MKHTELWNVTTYFSEYWYAHTSMKPRSSLSFVVVYGLATKEKNFMFKCIKNKQLKWTYLSRNYPVGYVYTAQRIWDLWVAASTDRSDIRPGIAILG